MSYLILDVRHPICQNKIKYFGFSVSFLIQIQTSFVKQDAFKIDGDLTQDTIKSGAFK